MKTRPEKRARPTHLVPREGDQPFDQQLAALLRRPIHSSRVKRGRSVVSFLPVTGRGDGRERERERRISNADTGVGRGAAEQQDPNS
jgi:hypothetical protein